MLAGYIPLVLDPTIQADGFGTQILEILQINPGDPLASPPVPPSFAPLPRLFAPNPSRKGKSQIVIGFQNTDDGGSPPVIAPTGEIVIRVRSPFVYDDGSPVYAPTLEMIANPSIDLSGPVTQAKLDALLAPDAGGLVLPATLADQNLNPSFGFSPLFQGKKIPNWTFHAQFTAMSETAAPPVFVLNWYASVAS